MDGGIIDSVLRRVPLAVFRPFRVGVVRLRRGSPVRSLCSAVLQRPARAMRGQLGQRLREIRPLDRPELSFAPTDSMVIDAVYWFGVQGYEGRVADVWTTLCGAAQSVLEVGGNVGLFSVIGGQACRGRYTVVEPVDEVATVLEGNLRRNGAGGVELLRAAAIPGDAAMDVTLDIPAEGRAAPVGAHLSLGGETVAYEQFRRVTVTGLPFRDLVRGRDLLKIDAEGLEVDLLAGARDLIAAQRTMMVIEVLQSSARLATLLCDMAAEMGFAIAIIPEYGSNRLVHVAPADFRLEMMARHNSKDVLLAPAATIARLAG